MRQVFGDSAAESSFVSTACHLSVVRAVGAEAELGEFTAFRCDFVGLRLKMALFASGYAKLRPGWAFPASGWMQPVPGCGQPASGYA